MVAMQLSYLDFLLDSDNQIFSDQNGRHDTSSAQTTEISSPEHAPQPGTSSPQASTTSNIVHSNTNQVTSFSSSDRDYLYYPGKITYNSY